MDDIDSHSRGASVVVTERAWKVNLVFGILVVMFALALVRVHVGATTDLGSIVGDVFFGAVLTGTIAGWLKLRRHPARLEISPEAITLAHRGGRSSLQLFRTSGDLYLGWSGRYPQPYLRTVGATRGLALWTFDLNEVERACGANGWRFAGRHPK